MMNRFKLIFLLLLSIIADECLCDSRRSRENQINGNKQQSETSTVDSKTEIANQIALGVLNLSQQLTSKVLSSSSNNFEVMSPISIGSALQLVLLGAKGNTFNELKEAMNYGNYSSKDINEEFAEIIKDLKLNSVNPKRKITNWREQASQQYIENSLRRQDKNVNYTQHKIEVANGIFVQSDISIRNEYKEVVEKMYGSHIESLNFKNDPGKASQVINAWVSENTHGKISEIVPKVMNPNTKIVLANALYFKAEWQQTFFEAATGPKPFYPHGRGGKSITVDLMAQGGHFPHYRDPELNVEILGFPYKQNCTTMYVILPSESSTERLKQVQKELTADKIENMIDQMTIKTAVILFPKMHLKSGYHLKSDLQDLGVKSLFQENESDLSVMSSENCAKMTDGCSHRVTFPDILKRNKREVTYKVGSENKDSPYPLNMKDFFNRKRIVKKSHGKKSKKTKREVKRLAPIDLLEHLRQTQLPNPQVFADDVIHKVDLNINEKGTEGGASTAVTLNRSGTNVVFRVDVPFMFLIRHDTTKIPLFYGVVFEPPAGSEKSNGP
ncbi:serine protease inhibitor 28Dc [Chironomus tepperi]|uniref:serine protease inhibitor 28Dc n=1 Tax=Chironomus tepperi TaxID=113505 RepID=UPI00391FB71A